MRKLNQVLSILAYTKRVLFQFFDLHNLQYFYLVFYGFTPNKGYYYDFKKYGYKNFVSDYKRYVRHGEINYKYKEVFKDKYANFLFLQQFSDKVVPVSALVVNGVCHSLNSNFELEEGRKYVLKPRTGYGGKGVFVVEAKQEKLFLNGEEVESTAALFRGLQDYVLVPYVFQNQYAASINPLALNTIRLLTCILNEKVEVIGACHRFGSNSTGNVDNVSRGGISAKIDIGTGVISSAFCIKASEHKKIQVDFHPDSKQPVVGVKIPHWEKMLEEMMVLHSKIKFVKYIGWDIAITATDFLIIEANHVSDVDGFQVHGPLLAEDLNREFYREVKYA